jgi:hypothetical protein
MKRLLLLIVFFGIATACEDAIDVELNDSAPRLVIDASFNKIEESNQVMARVKLSTTKPFFSEQPSIVDNATVRVITEEGFIITLAYFQEGIYTAPFPIETYKDYRLEVVYKNETYTATEQLELVPSLEFVKQNNQGGFTGEDIELKAFFTDPVNVDNFYFFEGISEKGAVYDTFFDEFFDGNLIFGFYLVDDLEANDSVAFNLYGVDEQFYDFMFTLLQQSSDQGGGPFETQPATVRGNIVNTTNPDNFPLGYFRISEVSSLNYTVQ